MNPILIIFIVMAALAGAAITYFAVSKRIKKVDYSKIYSQEYTLLKQENEKLQTNRYRDEEIIKDLNFRITQLDKELSKSVSNNIDDVTKGKLIELNTIRKKVSSLEDQLKETNNSANEIEKKFKKKITELEDELDEKEDESDSLKRRTKILQNELQQEKDESLKKQELASAEFEMASNKLTKLQKDIECQKQSLDFIQEVLSAKQISDKSVSGIEERVDIVTNYIRSELRDCLVQIFNFSKDQEQNLFGSSLETWAVTKKKAWIQGKKTIAFVGEFSAGKTSIVNRLLSNDDPDVPKLPTSMKATTAIPTYISGGIKTIYSFVTPNNIQKEISENSFKRVNKQVLDSISGISSLIQYFVMTYKNPVLEKLSILDTPGFSSNDSEDAMRTIEVINECDALFWVFDVNAGTVNRKSIDIINNNLNKPLYIVINQIDTKAGSEVRKVEKLITDTLTDSGVKVKGVIKFSIKEPLSVMTNVINSIPCDQNKENYIETIFNDLDKAISSIKLMMDEKNIERKDLRHRSEELKNQFSILLNTLSDNSKSAGAIPQYNSRLFASDDYRMSKDEFSELAKLLSFNVNHCVKLSRSYSLIVENAEKLSRANDSFKEYKNIHCRMGDCKTKLKYLIKYI